MTLGVLGQGGMGVVLSAFDPQLDRKVAIKILHPQLSASHAARARLQREALAMARLAHPNVVTVYEVGYLEAQLFIAMELVEGVTLRTWLAQRGRGRGEILAILLAAGRGLVAAHEVGLVHRDFKPENVLVACDGRVRVTDFGVARLSLGNDAEPAGDGAIEPQHPLTRAGAILGTPRYMAPEQRRGEPADERADQFSFCVALWEALYGECPGSRHGAFPIAGTNASAPISAGVPVPERALSSASPEPAEAAMRAHTARTAPADAWQTPRRSPAWLRRILERGLADDPAARWPSMTALLDAIERTPLRRRRIVRWAGGFAAAAAATVALMLARNETATSDPCAAQQARLIGVWDAPVRARARAGFEATGSPLGRPTWDRVAERLDGYAGAWLARARATCRATLDRGQSEEVGSLRDRCLAGRLAELGALTTGFATIDRAGVAHAVEAVSRLPELAICDDVAALRELPMVTGEQVLIDMISTPGWTSIVPASLNNDGLTDLLAYNATTGRTQYDVNSGGGGQAILVDVGSAPGWTSIVPMNLNDDSLTDFLSYNATTGRAVYSISTASTGGSGQAVLVDEMSTPGWTSVVPMDLNNDSLTDLLSYNTATGRAVYSVNTGGGRQAVVRDVMSTPGWTSIVPMNLNNDGLTDLLAYNATTGRAVYSVNTGGGGQRVILDVMSTPGWTTIVPANLNNDGLTDLLAYNATTGRTQYSVSTGGGGQAVIRDVMSAPGWTSIVPMKLNDDGLTDSLRYNAATGRAVYAVAVASHR